MKKLALHARICLAAVVLCSAALAGTLILRPPKWAVYTPMILAAGLATLFLCYIPVRKKLISAQLIVENAILHIQPAVLCGPNGGDKANPCETVEMYVSVFGVLLGSKIIKWGQDGGRDGRLKAVEIGRGYLSIAYGAKEDIKNIRLLYNRPGDDTLAGIIEKFRYETGIVPVVKE